MAEPIHVVEPTLEDEAGHCHSFLGAVAASDPEQPFEVYAGRRVGPLFADLPRLTLHPHFVRRLRRLQAIRLYRRLLARPGRLFVPTAGATDLALVDLVSRGELPRGAAAFFFHWIRDTPSRRRRLTRAARRQPQLTVMGATREIVAVLAESGFAQVRLVPYPVSTRARPPQGPAEFRHVLFAGAARRDKGFDRVVALVEALEREGDEIPFVVQTSARHYGKHDDAIAADVRRLLALGYRGLRTYPQTLATAAYLELFQGAICLQPYVRGEFAGRVSAVTVDALASGSPVISTAGTWMGETVERLEAGIALEDLSPQALRQAVRAVVSQYDRYSANARKAAEAVQQEHSGRHLLDAIRA